MSKHAPESQRSKIIPEIKDYSEEKLLKNHREGPHSIPQHNCPSINSAKLETIKYVTICLTKIIPKPPKQKLFPKFTTPWDLMFQDPDNSAKDFNIQMWSKSNLTSGWTPKNIVPVEILLEVSRRTACVPRHTAREQGPRKTNTKNQKLISVGLPSTPSACADHLYWEAHSYTRPRWSRACFISGDAQ